MKVRRWALYFNQSNSCLISKGISPQVCCRQIVGVLLIAQVHRRRASYWTLNNGSSDVTEEKKYASIPYSMTGRMIDRYTLRREPVSAPQFVPFRRRNTFIRFKHLSWMCWIWELYEPFPWKIAPKNLYSLLLVNLGNSWIFNQINTWFSQFVMKAQKCDTEHIYRTMRKEGRSIKYNTIRLAIYSYYNLVKGLWARWFCFAGRR